MAGAPHSTRLPYCGVGEGQGESLWEPQHRYGCMSLMCVAMYHLFPKLSCTAALRSP